VKRLERCQVDALTSADQKDDEVVADLVGLLRGRQVFPVGGEHGEELALRAR
jgi:hypothetical protein